MRASALWARYHDDLIRRRRAPATIRAYRYALRPFWASVEPKKPLRATPTDLEHFLNRPRAGRVLSDATRSSYASAICGFYRWAEREQLTPRDRMARFVPPKRPTPIPRVLNPEDVAAIFALIERLGDERLLLMVWLAYACALRVGEIARLRIEHIHLRDNPPWLLVHGKGNKLRQVPVSDFLHPVLTSWLTGRHRTGPLLPNEVARTRNIGRARVGKLIASAMHNAGVHESAHSLRHTFAVWALEEGGSHNLLEVSRILGHVTTEVTERTYLAGFRGNTKHTVDLLPHPRAGRRRGQERSGQGADPDPAAAL